MTVTSTLDQPLAPVPTSFAPITKTIHGSQPPALTLSNCITPYPAVVTDPVGNPLVYFQYGCGYWNQDCCPPLSGWGEGVVFEHCAADYTTQTLGTYSACCPTLGNFTLFSSGIVITPCASKLTGTLYVAKNTPTNRNGRFEDNYVFAVPQPLGQHDDGHDHGSATKITITTVAVIVLLLLLLVGLLMFRRARGRQRRGVTSPSKLERPSITSPRSVNVSAHANESRTVVDRRLSPTPHPRPTSLLSPVSPSQRYSVTLVPSPSHSTGENAAFPESTSRLSASRGPQDAFQATGHPRPDNPPEPNDPSNSLVELPGSDAKPEICPSLRAAPISRRGDCDSSGLTVAPLFEGRRHQTSRTPDPGQLLPSNGAENIHNLTSSKAVGVSFITSRTT